MANEETKKVVDLLDMTEEQKVSLQWVTDNPHQHYFTIPQYIRIPFQYLNKYGFITYTEKGGWVLKKT